MPLMWNCKPTYVGPYPGAYHLKRQTMRILTEISLPWRNKVSTRIDINELQ